MMKSPPRSTLGYLGTIPGSGSPARTAEPIFCRFVFLKLTPQLSVRSALAFLLILISGLPALLPMYSSSESSLPACCRRDGKHRCMMALKAMADPLESGRSFRNASPDCPYRSHPSQLSGAHGAPLVSGTSIQSASNGSVRCDHRLVPLSFSGAHTPSRGPPAIADGFSS